MKLTKTKLKQIIREEIQKLNESKMTASKLVKIFKNKSDWGDQGDYVRVVKGNLEVIDTFYYGGAKALKQLIHTWTNPNGEMAKFMMDEYGIKFKLVDSFEVVSAKYAGGWYKKRTDDGIVSVTLKVVN